MFDFVRRHNKLMMGLMFLLIFPSFVLFGIERYNRLQEKGAVVARVAGKDITEGEWDAAHKTEVDRLRAQRPNVDAKLFDTPEARYATLERLVRDRVLAQAAENARLTTGDARLARALSEEPAIKLLRGADGKLDMERYRQLVGAQGLTPEGFEARVRNDLAMSQVQGGISNSTMVSNAVADLALNAFFERREIQLARFAAADYRAKVNLTDADVEAYYKAHAAQFQSPESASVEYVVLDLDAVKKGITLNEADVRGYYEQNAARLASKEERRASHILINAPKDAPATERDKARARAQELLAQVRKAPDTFAEVARKNSQDTGSAVNGGDLDFFTRGAMVKPFEDAAFAMKKGDISNVVETDFGFHIIRLTDVKASVQRSFEELRPGLESELKTQQAQRKFAEVAEVFTNTVYEQSDSLKAVADKLKLDIKTVTNVGRVPVPGATGPLANTRFLTALFQPDSLQKKHNTEAMELAPNQMVAGRIAQYQPARQLPLEEVRAAVRERLAGERAAELARRDGAEKLQAWRGAPGSAQLAAAKEIARDQPGDAAPQIVQAVMRADTTTLPAWLGVDLGAQGYAVVRINKVSPRAAPQGPQAAQERQQVAQWWGNAEVLAYTALLKERFKAEILASQAGKADTETTVPR